MHIAIVGNIGAGKTTLTTLVAKHYGYEPMYESIDGNPYIEDFYKDMQRWSFNLQIYFLNSRMKQLMDIKQMNRNVVQDRTIYEDAYIFAKNLYEMELLAERDYQTYSNTFNNITSFITPPDLLIYLKASVPALVNNIQRRGREYEATIRLDYLAKLNDKYEEWIRNYSLGKLLIVDRDKLDYFNNSEDLGYVINQIERELNGLF